MSPRVLHLSQDFRDEIIDAARATFPLECCGLIEGLCTADAWHVLAIHNARNLAEDPASHFLVDPQSHFELLRSLRGSERRIIGCFHSHPNGRAAPSASDRSQAIEDDFVWLIASGEKVDAFELNAYVFANITDGFVPLLLCR